MCVHAGICLCMFMHVNACVCICVWRSTLSVIPQELLYLVFLGQDLSLGPGACPLGLVGFVNKSQGSICFASLDAKIKSKML